MAAVGAREEGGEADPGHICMAEGLGGEYGGESRVDAATKANDRLGEAAFVSVVSQPKDKGIAQSVQLVGHSCRGASGSGWHREIEDAAVLGEGGENAIEASVGSDGTAAAVEDEVVVSTDEVTVDDRALAAASGAGNDGATDRLFASVPGTCGKVEDEVGSRRSEFFDGVVGVDSMGGDRGVSPNVFAKAQANPTSFVREDCRLRSRLEVAGFIKDVVGGQKALPCDVAHLSIFAPGSGIGKGMATGGSSMRCGTANNGWCHSNTIGNRVEDCFVVCDEMGLE